MHFWIWLSIAGVFVVLEILTLSLIFISLALAAVIGGFAAALWSGSVVQWIAFSVTAVITLGLLRPFVRKYLFKKSGDTRTGFSALVGEKGVVLTQIDATSGTVNLRGETWTARSETGLLSIGSTVEVDRIDGAKAVVKRSEN